MVRSRTGCQQTDFQLPRYAVRAADEQDQKRGAEQADDQLHDNRGWPCPRARGKVVNTRRDLH